MALIAAIRPPSVCLVGAHTSEQLAEIRCLRLLVETLVKSYGVPWAEVLGFVRRHEATGGRMSWRVSYLFALEEAAAAPRKPRYVLSNLPVGDE